MAPPAWNAGLQTGTRGAPPPGELARRARRNAVSEGGRAGLERRLQPAPLRAAQRTSLLQMAARRERYPVNPRAAP